MQNLRIMVAVCLVWAGVAVGTAAGQPVPGLKFEFGTAVSWYHTSAGWAGVTTDSYTNLNVPLRWGWFVWRGLEIEPQITLIIPLESGDGGLRYYGEFRVLWNFKPSGRLTPYLGAGTGFGNGLMKRSAIAGSGRASTMADCLLAGAKVLLGKTFALRAEYRFGIYGWKDADASYKEGGTLHNVDAGLSVFF